MAGNLCLFLNLFKWHGQVLLHWERGLGRKRAYHHSDDTDMVSIGGTATETFTSMNTKSQWDSINQQHIFLAKSMRQAAETGIQGCGPIRAS